MNGSEAIKKAYEAILQNDFEQAINWFEQAISSEPDNADYYYRLSITNARSNQLANALKHGRTAVELSPGDLSYKLHLQRLQCRERMIEAKNVLIVGGEQLHSAVSLLEEAVDLDPLSVEARILLGFTYSELGDYRQARQALQEAIRLNPQNDTALRLLREYSNRI